MTWCAKIYEMFNGWTDEEHQLAIESSSTARPRRTIIPDSPFLARSTTINDPPLFNSTFRDYQGEHICADTLFSCHQLDQRHDSLTQSYGIATIANTPLNLSKSMGNRQTSNHRRKQASLSRSLSFEYPMYEQQQQQVTMVPRMRHSLNPISSRTRPQSARQDSMGYRVSTRSTYSMNDSDHRNDEHIEQLVQANIKEMFYNAPDGVFPMIYRLPLDEDDRYRIEGGYDEPSKWSTQTKFVLNDREIIIQNIASIYSKHFYDKQHENLYGIDEQSNPVVMSIRSRDDFLSIIVRTKDGSRCLNISNVEVSTMTNVQLAKQVYPDLVIDHFENSSLSEAREHIKTFDEKLEIQKFKFGVIYQKKGQTTEEEFFNNNDPKRSFEEFLDQIASKVSLKNFKGYRAGLDVSEQTDCPFSYYEVFDEKEIMFHVSTMLPYSKTDSNQIQRKRHIGNDIVAIVFQEENTPFHPSMIKSSFLHVFLVIQPAQLLSRPCYKMMLVSRYDIDPFPPRLQPNTVYVRTAEKLRDFILTKLINAEYSAYRCRTFSLLQERTRSSYLKTLCETLSQKTYETLCDEKKRSHHRRSSVLSNSNSNRRKYLPSMKKFFPRSQTLPDGTRQSIKSDNVQLKSAKKFNHFSQSVDEQFPSSSEHRDDSSNDDQRSSTLPKRYFSARNPLYYGDESDEGLDSMSSADTTTRGPYDSDDTDAFTYRQQIRKRSFPLPSWTRVMNQRHISTPLTAGIHTSESSTV